MRLSISELFNKSWEDIKDQLPLVAALSLVYGAGLFAISMIPMIGSLISGPFTAGYMICLLKIRNRQTIDYPDVFWGFMNFNRFLQLLLTSFLVGLITIAGVICLVIPGIWFAVASSLATAYIVREDSDAITAIKKSLAAVKGHWWKMLLLLIVFGLLGIVGAICFLVGLLIAMPLITMMALRASEVLDPGSLTQQGPSSSGGPSVLNVNPSN